MLSLTPLASLPAAYWQRHSTTEDASRVPVRTSQRVTSSRKVVIAVINSANQQPHRWWCLPWVSVTHVLVLMVVMVTVVSLMRWGYDADKAIGLVATMGAVSLTIVHRMLSISRRQPA